MLLHALFLTWLAECQVLAGEIEAGEAIAFRLASPFLRCSPRGILVGQSRD